MSRYGVLRPPAPWLSVCVVLRLLLLLPSPVTFLVSSPLISPVSSSFHSWPSPFSYASIYSQLPSLFAHTSRRAPVPRGSALRDRVARTLSTRLPLRSQRRAVSPRSSNASSESAAPCSSSFRRCALVSSASTRTARPADSAGFSSSADSAPASAAPSASASSGASSRGRPPSSSFLFAGSKASLHPPRCLPLSWASLLRLHALTTISSFAALGLNAFLSSRNLLLLPSLPQACLSLIEKNNQLHAALRSLLTPRLPAALQTALNGPVLEELQFRLLLQKALLAPLLSALLHFAPQPEEAGRAAERREGWPPSSLSQRPSPLPSSQREGNRDKEKRERLAASACAGGQAKQGGSASAPSRRRLTAEEEKSSLFSSSARALLEKGGRFLLGKGFRPRVNTAGSLGAFDPPKEGRGSQKVRDRRAEDEVEKEESEKASQSCDGALGLSGSRFEENLRIGISALIFALAHYTPPAPLEASLEKTERCGLRRPPEEPLASAESCRHSPLLCSSSETPFSSSSSLPLRPRYPSSSPSSPPSFSASPPLFCDSWSCSSAASLSASLSSPRPSVSLLPRLASLSPSPRCSVLLPLRSSWLSGGASASLPCSSRASSWLRAFSALQRLFSRPPSVSASRIAACIGANRILTAAVQGCLWGFAMERGGLSAAVLLHVLHNCQQVALLALFRWNISRRKAGESAK